MGVGRGILTKEVQEIAKKHIGREINVIELRLIPYIQYVMVNAQKINIGKINQDEREILRKWKDARLIEGGASGLSVTKDFGSLCARYYFKAMLSEKEKRLET